MYRALVTISWAGVHTTYDLGVNFLSYVTTTGRILDVSGTPDAKFLPHASVAPYIDEDFFTIIAGQWV